MNITRDKLAAIRKEPTPMTDIIERLEKLYSEATGRPWHVVMVGDDPVIATGPSYDHPCVFGNLDENRDAEYRAVERRKVANADLVCLTHNALPELLRLARVGREAESMKGETDGV